MEKKITLSEEEYDRFIEILVNSVELVDKYVEKNNMGNDKILFINGTNMVEKNLTGVVAMQVANFYNRPCLVLRKREDKEGIYGGSGRNINNSPIESLKDFLEETKLFELVSGHPNAMGIEPGINANYSKASYQLNILNDFFESHDFNNQSFNMIVMLHVFEHFYNINQAIAKCYNLLFENGYLFLEIPNILKPFKSPDHYFLRYVHLINFSEFTVQLMLAKHGFSTLYIDSKGSAGAVPKNILLLAQKQLSYLFSPVTSGNRYRTFIIKLWLKRIEWYVFGWIYFIVIKIIRSFKSKLVRSKPGQWLKKMIKG